MSVVVRNVSKSYKKLKAVDNLSFDVERSSCFGFLGPNGAGKTTMMRMLSGKTLRDRDSSEIKVFGYDPNKMNYK